jgi:hypothetical protein
MSTHWQQRQPCCQTKTLHQRTHPAPFEQKLSLGRRTAQGVRQIMLIDQDNTTRGTQETPHRMRRGSRCTEKCRVPDTLSHFSASAKPPGPSHSFPPRHCLHEHAASLQAAPAYGTLLLIGGAPKFSSCRKPRPESPSHLRLSIRLSRRPSLERKP